MPLFKKHKISIDLRNGLGDVTMDVTVNINSNAEFYCRVPEEVLPYFDPCRYEKGIICQMDRSKKLAIYATSFATLEAALIKALTACNQPVVTEEHVIRYNIESHVTFAQNEEGGIFPNAGFEGATWSRVDDADGKKKYGDHHATQGSEGGYSLTIGAKAMTKVTTAIGDRVSVEYRPYYKGANHLSNTANAATLLNSWCSFSLPKHPKEMPYSDAAAMFFHNLMLGMAKLSKQIQEATFNQEDLLLLIESSNGNLLGGPSA